MSTILFVIGTWVVLCGIALLFVKGASKVSGFEYENDVEDAEDVRGFR